MELYGLEALLKLQSDRGIIHIKGVTISVIIVCAAIIIIIIIIHNVGMCGGSIPNRNWTVVMVVIKLILCAIPYKEGYVSAKGCLCEFVYGRR